MGDRRPWPRVLRQLPGMKRPRGEDETQTVTSQHRAEKITVDVDADLLQCCVCSGPLTAPLFHMCAESISHDQCFQYSKILVCSYFACGLLFVSLSSSVAKHSCLLLSKR